MIHESVKIYGDTRIGRSPTIMENVIIGYPTSSFLKSEWTKQNFKGAVIGDNAVIRSNTVIYCDVEIGDSFTTGHNVVVREKTRIGDNVLLGTNTIVEGNTTIGSNVSIQSNVYIPINTVIEDLVFIGPNAVLTNDKYPLRRDYKLEGPVIRRGVTIGANSILLPSIEIGEGAFIAAGSVVTKDVPPWKLAIGCPAKIKDLPDELRVLNRVGTR